MNQARTLGSYFYEYNYNYIKLQEYCGEGFNIARANFLVFENLLILMLPAHIREVDEESINKTMKNFMLDKPDYMAKLKMKELIDKAFRVKRRRFDNWFRLKCEWTKKLSLGCLFFCCKKDEDEIKEPKRKKFEKRRYAILDQIRE